MPGTLLQTPGISRLFMPFHFMIAQSSAKYHSHLTLRRQKQRRNVTSPWGNEDTQELIDILGRYNVKATFFVVGDWVDKYPESVKALHDAGHEVMNHSNTHAHMSKLSREEIIADVEACSDKIEAVTGVRPTLIRPPYGEYNDTVISAIRSIGMEPIQWDVDVSPTASRA